VFVENRGDVDEERTRVQALLRNLRIEAELMVLCLSTATTYRCIVNGETDFSGRVNDILGHDQWWQDLRHLRHMSSTKSGASTIARATAALRDSLAGFSPVNRLDVPFLGTSRRNSVTSGARPSLVPSRIRRQSLAVLPQALSMRVNVGGPHFFNHAASESSSEDEDDAAIYDDEDTDSNWDDHSMRSDVSPKHNVTTPPSDYFTYPGGSTSSLHTPLESPSKRGAFSASAHALLDVDENDTPHVTFKPPPKPQRKPAIPELELDFNMLPSRAQYLIINDLIRSQSQDTAVVFTTLPAPTLGTFQDEEGSLEYVSGLELLCEDIPPVLLIHSNSLVVTLAL
jgi:solute carrier family 12 (potassium/chloride transporters), member 9